ncbi:MAG: imidazoleglycerol-phosphate dehydratase HisB [Armatimonadetes bacterium]|nr:imidazoleglycerol-phosphate dehydratase HisB [Armatimonadota bacterium]
MAQRKAQITRETKETSVTLSLELDGQGEAQVSTGVGFFDHMLTHIARHGMMNLTVQATGDLEVDAHHLVEDVGIVLGKALAEAVGDRAGLRRYGFAAMPMDEALVLVAVDLSGRPGLEYKQELPMARVGDFDVELAREFFQAVANNAALTLHVHQITGRNTHHLLEATFKSFGRALDEATSQDPRLGGQVPSTKGVL